MSSTKWKQRKTVMGKIKIKMLKFVGIAVMGMGCSEKESVQSQNLIGRSQLLAERITINHFDQNISANKLSEEEFIKTIDSESIFYNRKKLSEHETEFQQCISIVKKMYGVINYQSETNGFRFQEGVKNCRNQEEQVSSEIHSQHISQWVFEQNTLATNQLHYQNVPKSVNAEFLHKYYQEKNFNNGDKIITYIFESSTDNESTSCKTINNQLNNCSFRRKEYKYIAQDQEEKNGISIFKFKKVVRANGTYYKSGSITFIIDNWTGEIIFTDSEVIPNYTATNGEITISGSIKSSVMKNSGESAWR